jgi:arginyl-tRNA synthetase
VNRLVAEQQEAIEKAEAAGEDTSELRKISLDEKARQYFKAMCDKDPKAIALWSKFRQLSIERYMSVYARLNIHFDQYAGESQVQEDSMRAAEKKVSDLRLSSISDGATVVDFSKHIPGKLGVQLGTALLRKRDNTSLYLTRDLGAIFERQQQFHFDQMIYVVAQSQELHLKQLFKLVELMDADLASKLSHVGFGLVRGMSTRKGTVVFLDDVLRDVGEKMHEVMKKNEEKYAQVIDPTKTADILGISSVMVQDLKGKRYVADSIGVQGF